MPTQSRHSFFAAVCEPSSKDTSTRGQLGSASSGKGVKEAFLSHAAVGSPLRWLRRASRSSLGTEEVPCVVHPENPQGTYRRAAMLQRQLMSGQSSEEVLYGHTHYVEAVKFTKCPSLGLLLITASWDHDVRVFQCASSKCIGRLCGHEGWITCLDVRAGWLVTGGLDKMLCIWKLDPAKLLRLVAHGQHMDARMQRPSVQMQHTSDVTACSWLAPGVLLLHVQ